MVRFLPLAGCCGEERTGRRQPISDDRAHPHAPSIRGAGRPMCRQAQTIAATQYDDWHTGFQCLSAFVESQFKPLTEIPVDGVSQASHRPAFPTDDSWREHRRRRRRTISIARQR